MGIGYEPGNRLGEASGLPIDKEAILPVMHDLSVTPFVERDDWCSTGQRLNSCQPEGLHTGGTHRGHRGLVEGNQLSVLDAAEQSELNALIACQGYEMSVHIRSFPIEDDSEWGPHRPWQLTEGLDHEVMTLRRVERSHGDHPLPLSARQGENLRVDAKVTNCRVAPINPPYEFGGMARVRDEPSSGPRPTNICFLEPQVKRAGCNPGNPAHKPRSWTSAMLEVVLERYPSRLLHEVEGGRLEEPKKCWSMHEPIVVDED